MRIGSLLLTAALALGACATEAGYRTIVSAWQGRHIDQLVASWGPPDRSFTLSSGGAVHEFDERRTYTTGGWTRTVPVVSYDRVRVTDPDTGEQKVVRVEHTEFEVVTEPVQYHEARCATRFTTDAAGVIVAYAFQGNDCLAVEPD